MKKTFLLTLALLLSMITIAQTRISYIGEHFDSEDLPSGWTFEAIDEYEEVNLGSDNWSIWKTHQAGGEPNELKLYWKPSFYGVARMVSPALNLTDVDEVIVSFKGFLDNYSKDSTHKLGIATSSDDGITWNTAWEDSYGDSNQGQFSFVKTVSTSDIGKENVKFCIFFEGNSGDINGWYFDDIEIYTLDDLNLGLISIDIPEITNAIDNDITFTVKNSGREKITSFSASYQIDDEDAVTQDFEIDLASLEEKQMSFKDKVNLIPGSHNMTITINSVNSKEDVTSDNVVSIEINTAISSLQRKPMIEHFSSSNCAPCVTINQMMALLTEKYHGQYTYTKYPFTAWPYDDPYKTDDGLTRKTYYNVSAVPTLFFDGDLYGNGYITDEDFEKRYNTSAYIDIQGSFNVNENDSTINIIVDIMPFTKLYNKRLFVSVNEKTTTKNTGANGETEFHHIMMKMFPDAEGTEIDLTTGELRHFEFTYDMNETFMEELGDLEVAVWIQDYYNYEIYNSNYMYEYTEHPYPAQNLQLTDNEGTLLITWDTPEKGNPVGYNIYVNDVLRAENIKELSYSVNDVIGLAIVNIVAIYENGKTSVSLIDNIFINKDTESIDENARSFYIYPNPAKDEIRISSNERIEEVTVYNINGQQTIAISQQLSANSCTINIANLNSGIYIIKINTEKENIVKRFIKY